MPEQEIGRQVTDPTIWAMVKTHTVSIILSITAWVAAVFTIIGRTRVWVAAAFKKRDDGITAVDKKLDQYIVTQAGDNADLHARITTVSNGVSRIEGMLEVSLGVNRRKSK